MIEKIKYILLALLGGLVSYLFGISSGKRKQKEKQEKETVKNVKKINSINNTPVDIIDSMYDKYE
jgi:hypothetical protein